MMVCVEAAALPQSDNGAVAHCRLADNAAPVIVTPMPITAGRRGAISVDPARAPNAKTCCANINLGSPRDRARRVVGTPGEEPLPTA